LLARALVRRKVPKADWCTRRDQRGDGFRRWDEGNLRAKRSAINLVEANRMRSQAGLNALDPGRAD
jgi:hypothetical protein